MKNIKAVKESAPIRAASPTSSTSSAIASTFAGLDDVALEGMMLGAKGWVSGLTSAFPQESVQLVAAAERGDWDSPPHLSAGSCRSSISMRSTIWFSRSALAEQIMGRGTERVRMPRMPLTGARRAEVTAMVEKAAATRPSLSKKAA